jgi:mitochondrial enoyl-[acyl-carrier protein] reductase / trans-2-enoyl-CoA reductase
VKKSINAVVYERHGIPAEVLQLVEQPWPDPGADEVVVRMRAAPVNPADLNAIEGKYPGRREIPAIPGFEGSGTVVGVGENVTGVKRDDLVILPHHIGTWREAMAVKASELVVVPPGIDPVQASMLKINPLTAWRLLHGYVPLKKGEWLIQNAANSGAGRAVIQIAHEIGYRTVNLVRRAELIEELRESGADVVLLDDAQVREGVRKATGGAEIRLGLNCVGGESALRVANCLSYGGTLVTFGSMSLQPLKVPVGLLIFKDLRLRGIWINRWYDEATQDERMAAFEPIFEMAKRGLLAAPVEKTYPLTEVKEAMVNAAKNARSGKVVLKM